MIKYNDFYDLLERFSIMTIDGKMTDAEAMRQLKNATTSALYSELDNLIKEPKKTAKNAPKEPLHADIKTLEKYINAGFNLYPCYESEKDTYSHITLNGIKRLYKDEEAKAKKERTGIKDIKTLREVIDKGITDTYGVHHTINYFRLFPLDNEKQKYIVIDIDNHEGKGDGFQEWKQYLNKKHIEGTIYNNLDNFPCYVTSGNNGKHLYFKFPYTIPENIKNLTKCVEILPKNHPITAGGTYRKASKNGFYVLHGNFEDAPILPLDIFTDMQISQKEREAPPQPKKEYKTFTGQYGASNGNSWNNTLEKIYSKALERNTEGKHGLIIKFCTYAKYAIQDGKIQATKSDIETFLFNCPEVIQHERGTDKGDTQHIINDYFNNL